MSISRTLDFAIVDDLYLDPKNPRLGRHKIEQNQSQQELLKDMREWNLNELAESYIENNGFWVHEALLVVREDIYNDGNPVLVTVEGNRRLATIKFLYQALQGNAISPKWRNYAAQFSIEDDLFQRIPFLLADSRKDVEAFLGFRHVTGIKEWNADEKAGFIAKMIEEEGYSYEQVMRKIGSTTPSVRNLYISYRTLLQIENTVDNFDHRLADKRFAILYMTLNTEGAKQYLEIDMYADPQSARIPVPQNRLQELSNFSLWLFGTRGQDPIVTDTRQVPQFDRILQSKEAIEYLEKAEHPRLDIAFNRAGGDTAEIIAYISRAADNIESALSRAHLFKENKELKDEIRRVTEDAKRLASIFPDIAKTLKED